MKKLFLVLWFSFFSIVSLANDGGIMDIGMNTQFTLADSITFAANGNANSNQYNTFKHACRISTDPTTICQTFCSILSVARPVNNQPTVPDLILAKGTLLKINQEILTKSARSFESKILLLSPNHDSLSFSCTTQEVSKSGKIEIEPTLQEIKDTSKNFVSF